MSNQTILLIENDPAVVAETRDTLSAAGYRVEIAGDGEAGIAAFRRLKPDLVVVDPLVGKKQGFEVCKEIKASPGGGATTVLIATDSYKNSDNRDSALDFYGCDEFLERPLSREALLALCRRFLVDTRPAPAETKLGGAVALDDLDESEIIARLDSLIDANFETGEGVETPAAPPPVPSATPAVEPVVPRPAAAPVPVAPAPRPATAIDLPSRSPRPSVETVPAVSGTRRRSAGSFMLLLGALTVGLLAVAVAVLAPRIAGDAGLNPERVVPFEKAPVASSPPAPAAAPAVSPIGAIGPAPTAPDSAAAPSPETPDGFVDPRYAPRSSEDRAATLPPASGGTIETEAPRYRPAAARRAVEPRPAVALAPELEAPFANPEPVRESWAATEGTTAAVEVDALMPEPEAPRPRRDSLFPLDAVDVPPVSLERRSPDYPAAAIRLRQEGVVEMEVLIDAGGSVVEARVVGGNAGSLLDRAALEAARGWSYHPAHVAGVPVRVWKPERIVFKY